MNKKFRSLLKAQMSMYIPRRLPSSLKKFGLLLMMGTSFLVGLLVLYYSFIFISTGIMSDENIVILLFCFVNIISIIFGITVAKGHLFNFSDYNLLMSLPIHKSELFLIKLSSYLLYVLSIYIIGLLPSFIYIGINAHYAMDYYLLGIVVIILSSIIPSLIAIYLSILFRKLSGNGKYQRLLENIFNILLLVVVFGLSMNLSSVDSYENINFIGEIVGDNLPFIRAYVDIIFKHNIFDFLILIIVVIIISYILINILSKTFIRLNEMANTGFKSKAYKGGGIKSNNKIMALFKMEYKRFLKNINYFLNTCIFGIILYVGVIYLLFNRELIDEISLVISTIGNTDIIYSFLILMICLFAIETCNISSISISLEGKNLWILKSSPISPKEVFLAKGLVNFTIGTLTGIIPFILLSIMLKLNIWYILLGMIILTLASIFVSSYGLLINLLFPKLEFDREIVVIKQSASVMIALLSNFLIMFLLGFIMIYLNDISIISFIILMGIYLIMDVVVLYLLNGYGVRKFKNL